MTATTESEATVIARWQHRQVQIIFRRAVQQQNITTSNNLSYFQDRLFGLRPVLS